MGKEKILPPPCPPGGGILIIGWEMKAMVFQEKRADLKTQIHQQVQE